MRKSRVIGPATVATLCVRAGAAEEEMRRELELIRTRVIAELHRRAKLAKIELELYEPPRVRDIPSLIKVLAKIEASRPLFIALLGERCGAEFFVKRGALPRYPWIDKIQPCSQLEIEVTAALENFTDSRGGLFFVRDAKFIEKVHESDRKRFLPQDPRETERLTALKQQLALCGAKVIPFSRSDLGTLERRLVEEVTELITTSFLGMSFATGDAYRRKDKDPYADPETKVTLPAKPPAPAPPKDNDAEAEGPALELPCKIGAYNVLRQLGTGGMGVVYAAEQPHLGNRPVALKLVRHSATSANREARFEFEAMVLARMQHPNIVTLYDAGRTDDGTLFMAMEHVYGHTLLTYCDKHKLPVEQRLELFAELCDATAAIHSKGVVHRNLTPHNILITTLGERPVVKVVDFGIAKLMDHRDPLNQKAPPERAGHLFGSLAYMAPEQAKGATGIDGRADIYVLGAVLYELLTGERALQVDETEELNVRKLIQQVVNADVPAPSSFYLEEDDASAAAAELLSSKPATLEKLIRSGLDDIVWKSTRKKPEDRYAAAHVLASEIRGWRPKRGWFG